ncbi:MAG: (d)CMP kinase [Deltaproteobacteria bacterium]|nr:(d)CMP kinase [Deltaproteobacteria bacterium]
MNAGLIIAVDGPSGAGKSSSSRLLAERLKYRYVDTGALYRIVGLLALEKKVSADDAERLANLCANLPLRFLLETNGARILLGERNITTDIRQPEVSQMASKVSAQPLVRQRLLSLQRELGAGGGVVIEGRDIGAVVFPEADVKFYLDASSEVRGRRRYAELQEQGVSTELQTTIQEMAERDQRDSNRAHAPLQRAVDAVIIDTTTLTLAEVVALMMRTVEAARKC